jgi:hypothetical protein
MPGIAMPYHSRQLLQRQGLPKARHTHRPSAGLPPREPAPVELLQVGMGTARCCMLCLAPPAHLQDASFECQIRVLSSLCLPISELNSCNLMCITKLLTTRMVCDYLIPSPVMHAELRRVYPSVSEEAVGIEGVANSVNIQKAPSTCSKNICMGFYTLSRREYDPSDSTSPQDV